MTPEHFFEQSRDMVSLDTCKQMARMAFMQGKVCASIQRDGADEFPQSMITEAAEWQAFFDAEMQAARNASVHPIFRDLLNGIGGDV